MIVLALTIFVSTALVLFFLVLFVTSVVNDEGGQQDVLLPLEQEQSVPATARGGQQ